MSAHISASAARLLSASRHSALPFLYPCCNAFAAVRTRRAMMSAFRSQPGVTSSLGTPPNAPSTSGPPLGKVPALVPDAAAPQIAARPPPLPKVEKARPKIRASKAALTITPKAVGRLQGLLKGPTPQLIRIGVRNKGCAGLSYHLEYVDQPGKFDEVVEQDGVRVLIDSKALFSIIGRQMMDFFSAVRDGEQTSAPTDQLNARAFAAAVASAPLIPITSPMPNSSMASMSLAAPSPPLSTSFAAVLPAELAAYLNDPATLVVDIRPHAAYADARLPRALSLSVPSTLLKRPLFSLDRLAAMLPSPAARHRFTAFNQSVRILVYDADANSIPESSNIYGLLRKFRAAHFPGELAWLRGGFQSVWREQRHLIDTGPQEDHDDDDPDDVGPAEPAATPVLRTRHLPMTAFGLLSTTLPATTPLRPSASNPFFDAVRQNTELSQGITERIPLRLPNRVRRRINELPFPWLREIARRADRMPTTLHPRVHKHMVSPPHAAYSGTMRMRSDPTPSQSPSSASASSVSDSSDSDAAPTAADIDEGTEALAMQFYRIELAEQRRLMGVMEHHSKESGQSHLPAMELLPGTSFPFSITAGVEKGTKNRYRHIWPFEHARVRLYEAEKERRQRRQNMEVDDYVNASYVQPLGTTRRYIATQGPLKATFEDFWRLTWQQNVHVIVMLTQEMEGATIKCDTYWPDTSMPERTFGQLHVTLIAKVALPGNIDLMHEESAPLSPSGFGFGGTGKGWKRGKGRKHNRITTIKRTFRLEHKGYPAAGVREVVQLQFLEWPDMNVPEDAREVLGLVREVERAVEETGEKSESPVERRVQLCRDGDICSVSGVAWHGTGGTRPVLLHCSAGVGRTGGFIAVDAVLDAVRREYRAKREGRKGEVNSLKGNEMERVEMDVDAAPIASHGHDGDVVTVPLPVSGDPSPGSSGSGSSGLVVHVPAVVVPTPTPINPQVENTPMTVDTESQTTRQWAENVDNPFVSPPPRAASSPTMPMEADGGATTTRNYNHPLALKVTLPPSSIASASSASASTSTSTSGSIFPFFSDSEGVSRMRGGSAARDSLSGTSVSGGSVSDIDAGDIKGRVDEEDSEKGQSLTPRFGTISEPQGHAHAPGRTRFHHSLGLGLGSSPLARSSEGAASELKAPRPVIASPVLPSAQNQSPQHYNPHLHPLSRSSPRPSTSHVGILAPPPISRQTTVDYKEPRALHGTPETPVALSTFEEPIWEVVQDMREQRMSLCQSLRQYVFVHQVIIEGALVIVDEEIEKDIKEGERKIGGEMEGEKRGEELDGLRLTTSPLPLPLHGASSMFSFGTGGEAIGRSNTLPPSFSPDVHHHPWLSSQPSLPLPPVLNLPQVPQVQKFNSTSSGTGVSSDSGSMKRGASPTELLKEGKKGEVLLSKRPSIKRLQASKDAAGSASATLEPVPPSPGTFQ
ncbi:hypothetical protein C0991_010814 [Blastosporella zonata]|nr:hypothetical protein C0991_010814 [Blastosporella zonata]